MVKRKECEIVHHPLSTPESREEWRKAIKTVRERERGMPRIKLNDVPIPRRFMLMGEIIEVEYTDDLIYKSDDVGHARYRENKIILQRNTETHPIPRAQIEHNFYHELMHFVFEKLNRSEMRSDEMLVDQIAGMLHQAQRTACYDEET